MKEQINNHNNVIKILSIKCLQMSCFIWSTVQNLKIFSLLSWHRKASNLHIREAATSKFLAFLLKKKRLKLLFSYQNSCQFIFCWSTNWLIVAALVWTSFFCVFILFVLTKNATLGMSSSVIQYVNSSSVAVWNSYQHLTWPLLERFNEPYVHFSNPSHLCPCQCDFLSYDLWGAQESLHRTQCPSEQK